MLALALSCILIPLGMLARSSARPPWGDRIAWVGLITMGLFSSLFVFTVLRDALLLILWLASGGPGIGLDRAAAGLGGGWRHWRWRPPSWASSTRAGSRAWSRWTCPSPACRPTDGFTIVQISDIHIGPTIKQRYVQAIVDAVNRESPDLVAITGDVVDGSVEQLAAQASPLASCARLMACIW